MPTGAGGASPWDAPGLPAPRSGGPVAAPPPAGKVSRPAGGLALAPSTLPSWSLLTVPHPSVLELSTMVHDAPDGYDLLSGGGSATTITAQTGKLTGSTWTLSPPALSPPARYEGAMAFAARDNAVALYGAEKNTSTLSDPWEFPGGVRTHLPPTVKPGPLYLASMANDPKEGHVVLFGGADANSAARASTWKFVGCVFIPIAAFISRVVGIALTPHGASPADTVRDALNALVLPVVFGAATGGQLIQRVSYRTQVLIGLAISSVGLVGPRGISIATPPG